jgi:methylmalonyl-CoA/ethylmalonyl-CoA epimerase
LAIKLNNYWYFLIFIKQYAMKKIMLISVVLAAGLLSVAFHFRNEKSPDAIITNRTVMQVAVVVKDIDVARKAWAGVFGVQVPEVSVAESHPSRPTRYHGSLSDAEAKLAFLDMGNLQVEIIQPLGGKSTWQEFLDTRGEGIHHIAFSVKDINGVEKKFEMQDMPVVQNGGWDGGAYSYIDASKNLGCILELLENYR